MCAVIKNKNTVKKIEVLLNTENSKCYFLDTSGKICYKNSVDFDSFELHKELKSNIITAQYNKGEPVYIEEKLGFSITHLKGLIENLKTLKPKFVIVNTQRLLDRIYENTLFLELDEVIDKTKTHIIIEYDYANLKICKNINEISIRFNKDNTIEDIDRFLDKYSNIKMIKITEELLCRYIDDENKFKKILKLLDNTYIIIEGTRSSSK